ncbi:MAG: alpha/beta hydrolase-fold protein [Myxococcota bacterium]|nr:alpha/beta hydrolase-fold protein [Myxococcota bacterium]
MKTWWLCLLAACGGSDDKGPRPVTFGDARPVDIKVPSNFDDSLDYPLIIGLHGYGSNAFTHTAYFGLNKLVNDGQAIMIAPDGTVDAGGKPFWNADAACCDFGGKNPDDVGYIGKLIDDIIDSYPIDKSRVFVIGHSNGGYMAYRMACERPDVITAIAGLAGAASSTPASCTPARSVNILHMHGTADATVPYTGTTGAEGSILQWAGKDGCGTTLSPGATYDLDNVAAGSETQALTAGCPSGVAVELWKMEGVGHIPNFSAGFTPTMWTWLKDHPRK